MLNESPQDIDAMERTVATEWHPGDIDQGRAIIDTILNRQASGRWGPTVRDVVNSPYQYSNVNGPTAWRHRRHSVDDIPASTVTPAIRQLVATRLAQRASGTPSIVGSDLNFANPRDPHISRRNRVWIDQLHGPTFGRGPWTLRFGTTPDNERYRPGNYRIQLPGNPPPVPRPRVPARNPSLDPNRFVITPVRGG